MKKIVGFLLVFLAGVAAFAYDVTADYQIKGKAKTVTRIDYEISSKFGEYS